LSGELDERWQGKKFMPLGGFVLLIRILGKSWNSRDMPDFC
jgi:hypothetical protein